MMLVAAFLPALLGFFLLALAMDRHHRQLLRRNPSFRMQVLFRILGATGLGFSFALCIDEEGWAAGPVLWCGLLTVAALVPSLYFSRRYTLSGRQGVGFPENSGTS